MSQAQTNALRYISYRLSEDKEPIIQEVNQTDYDVFVSQKFDTAQVFYKSLVVSLARHTTLKVFAVSFTSIKAKLIREQVKTWYLADQKRRAHNFGSVLEAADQHARQAVMGEPVKLDPLNVNAIIMAYQTQPDHWLVIGARQFVNEESGITEWGYAQALTANGTRLAIIGVDLSRLYGHEPLAVEHLAHLPVSPKLSRPVALYLPEVVTPEEAVLVIERFHDNFLIQLDMTDPATEVNPQ